MTFIHEYLQIMSDPAHIGAELTLTVLIDGLLLGVLWPAVRRLVRREHLVIDREHGKPHGWKSLGYIDEAFGPTVPDFLRPKMTEEQIQQRIHERIRKEFGR